jgi:phospholipid/cholesterol/gamma-HCH transport system substrate-binding protein
MNRRIAINLAVFSAVFALMLVWAVNNIVTIEALERPYPISGEFDQASGILPRAEVAYLGVNYGSVDRVDRIEGGVVIHMKIDRDKRIPAGSTANIFRKSSIGEPYIDFKPPPDYRGRGPFIEEGDRLPRDQTTVPLEFSELLRSASAVIGSVDAESTGIVVHELAEALVGRADDLRRLTIAGDRMAATFAERTELIDSLADTNTRLTRVVTEHRGSLGQSVSDLAELADSLRNARGDTSVLLERGSRFMTETADLVAGQKGNLDCILSDLEALIRLASTDEQLTGLRDLLTIGPRSYGQVYGARDMQQDGPWLRVGNIMNPNNPPPQYVPPRDPPPAPEVAPCTSPLRPANIDFEPAAASTGGPPSVPASALLLLGLAFLSAVTVVGLSRDEGRS